MCSRFGRSSTRARGGDGPRRPPRGARSIRRLERRLPRLLGDRPRRRDLLIEHLHLIQDRYHQISAAHLAALADEMKLSFAEVFETATFYAHFDVVKEGAADIPPLTIRVCDSLTCAMLGGEKLLQDLQDSAGPGIRVVRAPCVGRCDTAPAVEVGHHFVDHANVASVARCGQARRHPRASARLCRLRRLCRRRRLPAAQAAALGRPDAAKTCSRRSTMHRLRGPWRRGLSHRAKVARGARRARSTADGDQRR